MSEYLSINLNKEKLVSGDSIIVQVKLRNKGNKTMKEVVQLYASDLKASYVPAGKKLCGFKKILLNPGEEKTVDFIINEKSLFFADEQGKLIKEKGKYKLSVQQLSAEFNLE